MNNNIQCSIESSTTKIELNSAVEGVFLVPELEGLAGLPEIRTTSGVNAGYDGGWTSAQNYDARLISIRGVIANPDISKVEDKRRAIASLLGQGRKEQLTLRFTTEAGNAYAISVRTISCEMALQRVLTTQEFLIQLRADDPLIYDDGAAGGIAAILQPQRALGGFEINFDLPLAIGGGAEDTVVDNGNETVYPVIKLYGALHSPTVVNRTTNQQMQILADLQYSIDWHTYRSTTGDYILVNDGLDGAPMTLSQLLGNTEQTTYSGKNLVNINATPTLGHTTVSVSGQSITVTSDAQAITARAEIPFTYEANRQMTISFDATCLTYEPTATNTSIVYLRSGSDNAGYRSIGHTVGTTTHYTTTFTPTVAGMNLWLYIKSSNVAGVVSFRFDNIQIEYGASETDYEQFVGGVPAPSPQFPMPISTVTGAQKVVATGKNLFGGLTMDKQGYCTATLANNILTITPSDTTHNTSVHFAFNNPLRTGHYTLNSSTRLSDSTQLRSLYNSPIIINFAGAYSNAQFILNEEVGGIAFNWLSTGSTTPFTIDLSTLQIERGTTATAYEPYQGQSYEVNLGKNLLDINSLATTGVTVADGVMTATATDIYNAYGQNTTGMPFIKKDGQLSVSLKAYTDGNVSTTNNEGIRIRVTYTDGTNGTLLSFNNNQTTATAKSATTTAGKNVEYIQITYVNTGGNTWHISELQIEQGATPTSYAPYFTPIELAKIGTYQDRIYKDDGKWYIEKQVGKQVLSSSDNITLASSYTNIEYGQVLKPTDAIFYNNNDPSPNTSIASFATYENPVGYDTAGNIGKYILKASMARYFVGFAKGTGLDAIKSALNGKVMYYALATPTTTEITNETLLLQLNFLASLYGGVNNISLTGTGAQGEMMIRYATDYTVNQDIITIDSQARTITLNGQDVYHLKTSESEFLVLAPGENKLYLTSEVSDDSGYAEVKFKQGYLSI